MLPTYATTGGKRRAKNVGRQGIARRVQTLRASAMMGSASSPELTSQDLQATNSAHPAGAAHFLGAPYPPI